MPGERLARFGQALADPTRVLLALLDAPSYPTALADDLGVTRQTVSHHLACLRDCGLWPPSQTASESNTTS